MDRTLERGRWKTAKTARIYVREGEAWVADWEYRRHSPGALERFAWWAGRLHSLLLRPGVRPPPSTPLFQWTLK